MKASRDRQEEAMRISSSMMVERYTEPFPSRGARGLLRHRVLVASLLLTAGCATVRNASGPFFGRAPTAAGLSRVEDGTCQAVVTRLPSSDFIEVETLTIEGSTFLSPPDVERIAKAEACVAGAEAVFLTTESYGVPFVGSMATAVLVKRKAPPLPTNEPDVRGTAGAL
jgi:hypothetical protein